MTTDKTIQEVLSYRKIEQMLNDFKNKRMTYTEFIDEVQTALHKVAEEAREEGAKAYGGCTKCYGKGYSTYRHGLRVEPDFLGDKLVEYPPKTHMLYCECDRGIQLEQLKGGDE